MKSGLRLFIFLFVQIIFQLHANVHISTLKCEFAKEPMGVDVSNPRFSWNYMGNTPFCQALYQIEIASSLERLNNGSADILKTLKIAANFNFAEVSIRNLQNKTRYYWRVKVWSINQNDIIISPASWFETGIKSIADWKASWISDDNDKDFKPSPLFRKTFSINKKVKQARLYVSAAGYYELFLNGKRIGKQLLEPGYTHFDKRILYTTHDVTTLTNPKKNCISVVLGNGWYNVQSLAVWNFDQANWRSRPRLLCELNIEFADGTKQIITSDNSWKTNIGAYLFNNIYSGDVYDARLEEKGWKLFAFDETKWEGAKVVNAPAPIIESQLMPAIKVRQELSPKNIKPFGNKIYVVDFGKNSAGFCRLTMKAPKGTKITLKYGEKLTADGRLEQNFVNKYFHKEGPLVKRKEGSKPPIIDPNEVFQMDTYIFRGDGKPETFTPSFTYHGFQYIELESSEPIQLNKSDITALFFHTDVEKVGSFACSNDMLKKIYAATMRSYLSNLHSIPTDCPQREKNGWTADAYISIDLALLNYDGINLYEKWMRDFIDNQHSDGQISGIVPSAGWGFIDWVGPTWDLAMFVIPNALYSYYGQTRAIEQLYPTLEKYLNYLETKEVNGAITFGIGDWVPVKTKTPTDFTSMCTYFYDNMLMAKFAKLLGKDGTRYEKKAELIRKMVNEKYFNLKEITYSNGSQTALAYPLYIGLAPDEYREELAKKLNDAVVANNYFIDFGMMGSKYVSRVLTQYGYTETVMKMMLKDEEPSWGNWIKKGRTTLPESFEEIEYDKESLNHVFLGDISAWMLNNLAGIQQQTESVGFTQIIIKPYFAKELNWAEGTHQSINGMITSHWLRKNGKLSLSVTIPQNSNAIVYADKPYKVGAGKHKFEWVENQ